ncbi:hypothetical protein M885DRAFT_280783 [Pelagophyceae sp. CCMP2097]|nr:hypothetical protein M885DRAFT_280783 [Pelagophyceae sp. CCMP2097]
MPARADFLNRQSSRVRTVPYFEFDVIFSDYLRRPLPWRHGPILGGARKRAPAEKDRRAGPSPRAVDKDPYPRARRLLSRLKGPCRRLVQSARLPPNEAARLERPSTRARSRGTGPVPLSTARLGLPGSARCRKERRQKMAPKSKFGPFPRTAGPKMRAGMRFRRVRCLPAAAWPKEAHIFGVRPVRGPL